MGGLLLLMMAALFAVTFAGHWESNMVEDRQVMVNLMSWKWTDIAEECERYLGPNGFGGVQISPPNEHAVVQNPFRPWWERYLPVSYELQSRSGTETELRDMVKRCNVVGVRIYADVVINHMANGEMSEGSAGNPYDPETLSYPQVPYAAQDFSVHNQKCPSKSGAIEDYNDEKEIRNCNLNLLPDLDTSVTHVRYSIAKYMDKLIDIGVAGFRVSNAENIWPHDLKIIYESLQNLSSTFFPFGCRPFVFQEVNEDVKPFTWEEYIGIGSVTEFEYGQTIWRAIRGTDKTLAYLDNLEDEFYLMPSFGAVVFVDNPSIQRYSSDAIDFNEPRLYVVANAFMLAYPYGLTRVMSSFSYTSFDEGPPSDAEGNILSISINEDGSCGNGWVCEHRWREIKNMIGFRKASVGQPLTNWWSNDYQQIAFGRGDKAFIVLNNEEATLSVLLYTGLPAGEYCDIVSGDFDSQSRICTGSVITVDEFGFASFTLHKDDAPLVAIHVNAVLSDKEPGQNEPDSEATDNGGNDATTTTKPPPIPNPSPDQNTPDEKPTQERTTIFIYKETGFGQNLFILGGLTNREGCTGKANTSACAIPIRHITPGDNPQYNAWKTGDNYLDWYGAEESQDCYDNIQAEGTPLVWTTNDPSNTANVAANGYGYTPLNQWGGNYWMVDLNMDCAKTEEGWFELKAFLLHGQGWEGDISQEATCQGSPGGSKPYTSINHFARCGFINVYKFGEDECIIEGYDQESGHETPAVTTTKFPLTQPPIPPPSPLASTDQTTTNTPSQSPTQNPSTVTTNIHVKSTPVPPATQKRTTILIYKETGFGQNLFILGGLTNREGCTGKANTSACAIPIRHITPGDNAQYNAWKTGDNYLDWYGAEEGQDSYENIQAEGTPLVWTTNDPSNTANVAANGYGYTPLNQWGGNYWMVDLNMDCAKTEEGWFELKAFLLHGQGWEDDISQEATCQGSPGGSKPYTSINHFARCGFINVYKFGEDECIIEGYDQESGHETPAVTTTKFPLTQPPIPPPSPLASTDQTTTNTPSQSPTQNPSTVTTNIHVTSTPVPQATQKRTTIFIYKETGFGQNLFILGGLTNREGCTGKANTSACAILIRHITPGDNAQYNAWKTGDNYLDWYGAEEGQDSYENIQAEGTPLVWTTNDPSNTANVAANGYGYTPLNQWGGNYWMVDLNMDCAKTEEGWFELKAFLLHGQGWEGDISQEATCQGSPGGSKPYTSINHFARCGFINVYKFGEDECIIEGYDQESGHETPAVTTTKFPLTQPPIPPPSPLASTDQTTTNTPSQSPTQNPSTVTTNIHVRSTPVPQATQKRTAIFIYKETGFGQNLLILGGLTNREGCTDKANTSACAIPIRHITPGDNAQYNSWKTGDNYLDWYGAEEGQDSYENIQAEGTPLVWTTNDPSNTANVAANGYGYTPLNQWGGNYWMVDLNMDCAKTEEGWFELKAFLLHGQGWEVDISQEAMCQGSPGGSKPYTSINHFARCGFINVYKFGEDECIIEGYDQESGHETPAVTTTKFPLTQPPIPPPSPLASTDQTTTNTPSQSPTQNPSTVTTNIHVTSTPVPQATQKRTTIFIYKETGFGQNLFILGGLTNREGCTGKANTSACAILIRHITPGDNAQYNAWKTGDNYLDWYGAEEGQDSYENIQAEGTPLVWTTNDPSNTANVAANGYGYTPLNQWGGNYWMVDLNMDCAKTEEGWFELKAFLLHGQGWEGDISQEATCQGSPGGSKPYTSINHFARCGFINVYKFGEDECIIEGYDQESGHETPAVTTTKFPLTQPPIPPPSPLASTDQTTTNTPSQSPTQNPSTVTTNIHVRSTPVPQATQKRTAIFIYKETGFGQNLLILGGLTNREGCTDKANTSACAIPIRHITPGDNAQYNSWKTGDNYLDWYGAEEGQDSYENIQAEGTPLVWTTNDPSNTANVAANGYGYTPLNQWGGNYWMVDLNMDCAKTEEGWFELKAFLLHGQGWEVDISQEAMCQGSPGGSKPYTSINHFARCGFINVFKFGENECTIKEFSHETPATKNTTATQSSPIQTITTLPSPSSTSTQSSPAKPSKYTNTEGNEVRSGKVPDIPALLNSTSDSPVVPNISKRTIIFIKKDTDFGQYLFILGGIDHDHRAGCSYNASTSACAIPITHHTLGNNAQYNAWQTGDNYLDWYGAEEGQDSYENIQAEGTPLVWTTNDPSNTANVAANGYGYTPLNQWGDNYWMADLFMDCSKTEGSWFELKGFLMNAGWESSVIQSETCEGSAGGSKPFISGNHFARCGFVNVFTFGEEGCIIDSLDSSK